MTSIHGLEYLRIAPVTQNPKVVPRRNQETCRVSATWIAFARRFEYTQILNALRNQNGDL
jgi:hypothetical protein